MDIESTTTHFHSAQFQPAGIVHGVVHGTGYSADAFAATTLSNENDVHLNGSARSTKSKRGPRSAPDHTRRHSLPVHFLPRNLWTANTSRASLIESEEAARGEQSSHLDDATIAHRISALRQLNGATRTSHRYAKSTGARNSTFNQPVIVRTYSGTVGGARPPPRQGGRENYAGSIRKKREVSTMGKQELPPLEAFTFKGIMDSIQGNVADDLERIAEICARSRYSLSNQYEVHMPPHGDGSPFVRRTPQSQMAQTSYAARTGGPTLQAIESDDEQSRSSGRSGRTGGRRAKSVAIGTLETIMSSSRSSDEDKSKKKSASALAEEVRGRTARKEAARNLESYNIGESSQTTPKTRSRSTTFASMIIDNAQSREDTQMTDHQHNHIPAALSLVSGPARPQTSIAIEQDLSTLNDGDTLHVTSPVSFSTSPKPSLARMESRASTLRPEFNGTESGSSVFTGLSYWLPWTRPASRDAQARRSSHAEGSLRDLLKGTEGDKKGKGVDGRG